MFDWISDAIDWIGDGISSLWDSTIGGAVDAISDAVWDIMFEWLFNKVYGAVAELFMFIDRSSAASDVYKRQVGNRSVLSCLGEDLCQSVSGSRLDAFCLRSCHGGF